MLILTRRKQERIRIGDDIYLVVIGMNGNQARLGIEAPEAISIWRSELIERARKQQRKEAGNNEEDRL